MKDKEKHFWATDKQRRENLDLEKPLWEKIVGNDKIQIEYNNNKYQVSFKGKKQVYYKKELILYVKKFGELVLKNII